MPGSSGNGSVTRSTLRQQIADALRDEVLAGRLQPGQEFTVKEIAEQYGVSATPVREALVDLSAQGLLDADAFEKLRVGVRLAAKGGAAVRVLLREGTDVDRECVERLRALEAEVIAESAYLARWIRGDAP